MDNGTFHKDNDYIITVFNSNEGLRIGFPPRLIKPCFDACWYIYTILTDKNSAVNKFRVDTQVSEYLEVPEYASRVLVYLDVILECHARKIHTSLINCYSNNKHIGGLNALVSLLDKPKDTDKENILFGMVDDLLHSRDRQKVDDDLNKTFDKIINFIMQGSFKV